MKVPCLAHRLHQRASKSVPGQVMVFTVSNFGLLRDTALSVVNVEREQCVKQSRQTMKSEVVVYVVSCLVVVCLQVE